MQIVDKFACQLKSGDIVFDSKGSRIGILVHEAYVYQGYNSTEFDVMEHDKVTRHRVASDDVFKVQEWTPSQAV